MTFRFVTRRICDFAAGVALAGIVVLATSSPSDAAVISTIISNGYDFTNFDPSITAPAVGSNVNGISNAGTVVGTLVDANNASTFSNFSGPPTNLTPLNNGTGVIAVSGPVAFGINSSGAVVGGTGTNAFYLPAGGPPQVLPGPPGATNAFGINDAGAIVGQFMSGALTPGFVLPSIGSNSFITINAPVGPDVVNPQGINNNGLVVGFYLGTDGQTHGFTTSVAGVTPGQSVTGTAVADPIIPNVAGEPGATFVFSQLLGVNSMGLVAGYYGDSTGSQHGFLYNSKTGTYTFLDDPAAAFSNGVEATQITGINNFGEIAGFYTDAQGIAHSFVACPTGSTCTATATPEPSSYTLLLAGLTGLAVLRRRRPRVQDSVLRSASAS